MMGSGNHRAAKQATIQNAWEDRALPLIKTMNEILDSEASFQEGKQPHKTYKNPVQTVI